jgi:hypothetical protein
VLSLRAPSSGSPEAARVLASEDASQSSKLVQNMPVRRSTGADVTRDIVDAANRRLSMQAHPSGPRFTVVLHTSGAPGEEPVVLHDTLDADAATIAFHEARRRLIQDRVHGELLVVHHNGTRRVLREPLGMSAARPQ